VCVGLEKSNHRDFVLVKAHVKYIQALRAIDDYDLHAAELVDHYENIDATVTQALYMKNMY
jgi:hypothetical protein